jgi:hypothetical protein
MIFSMAGLRRMSAARRNEPAIQAYFDELCPMFVIPAHAGIQNYSTN